MTVDTTAKALPGVGPEFLPARRPRRFSPGWLMFVLILLLAGGAYYKWGGTRDQGPEFESEAVTRGDVTARVSATGTLEALTTVTVGSQVSGPVREVFVDFNSEVKAGQVLALLDPSAFQAGVSKAQAALDGANASQTNAIANLANSDAGVAQAEAQVESARAQLAQAQAEVESSVAGAENAQAGVLKAQAEMDQALTEFRRYEELSKRQLVSASDADQRRTTYKVAEASYQTALAARREARATGSQARARVAAAQGELRAAQTRYQAAQAQRQSSQAQVRSAQAQVRQAQANLDQALVDLDRTTLRSPINGTVISRKVDVGQTVAAAFQAPELFKIARDLHQMQVRVEVSEADIGQVKEGQPVEFKVDSYPNKPFRGKVTQVRVGPVEDDKEQRQNVVVYGVLVSAGNPDLLLRPGMTATVNIETLTRKDVLLIPSQALLFIPPEKPGSKSSPDEASGGKDGKDKKEEKDKKDKVGRLGTVWIPGPHGPTSVEIRTGVSDGELTEVVSGDLKEGDQVIVKEAEDKSKKNRRRGWFF